jgi:hypothetical protein
MATLGKTLVVRLRLPGCSWPQALYEEDFVRRITARSLGTMTVALAVMAAAGASATAAGTLPTLAVTMTGNSITAPSSVPAGAVNVVSTVSGEAQGSPTLVRLDPGVTFQQAFAAAAAHGGDPNGLQGLASIVFNALANKGLSSAQTVLTPGNYVALDTEKNNPTKWPETGFTVTSTASPAGLPAAGGTVKTEEFRILGPSRMRDGEVVRFENIGYLVHMVVALPVKNSANARKLTALLLAGQDRKAQKLVSGPPPGFVGTFSPGGVVQETLNAKPGTYVLVCFMNTQDGREHTQLGMEHTVTVTM